MTRVVALPCWRCFDAQPLEYRRDVLRRHIPSVAIEAGATLGWANYVDDSIGVNTFGMSAPEKVVFENYNIVPSAVVAHVEQVLSESHMTKLTTSTPTTDRAPGSTTCVATGSTTARCRRTSTRACADLTSNPSIFAKTIADVIGLRRGHCRVQRDRSREGL